MSKEDMPAAELERVKAQVDALLQARESMNERMIALSERIGELRSNLVDHERRGSDLEARMKKAIELVNQLKPEEILREVSKSDAKIEAIKTRINSIERVSDRIIEEMKDMRRTFIQFKNLQSVTKLAGALREDLKKAKTVEVSIERFASKVETIFREMEKRYEKVRNLEKISNELQLRFREVLKEFDKIKVEFVGAAKKDDLENLEKRVESGLKEAENLVAELKKKTKVMEQKESILEKLRLLDKLADSFRKIKSIVGNLDHRLLILEDFRRRTVTQEKISNFEGKVEKKFAELDKVVGDVKQEIKSLDKKLGDILKLSAMVTKISDQMKRFENVIKNLEKGQRKISKQNESSIKARRALELKIKEAEREIKLLKKNQKKIGKMIQKKAKKTTKKESTTRKGTKQRPATRKTGKKSPKSKKSAAKERSKNKDKIKRNLRKRSMKKRKKH